MPRDSNGLYTLPAGNPVISGSVITPTWANPTMDDLAAEMTDSLSRSGSGGMLVPFEFADGDAGNPGMAWINEPSTGFYRAGSGDMRASVFGNDSAQFTDDGLFQADDVGGFHQVADARAVEFEDPITALKYDGLVRYRTTNQGGIVLAAGLNTVFDSVGGGFNAILGARSDSGGLRWAWDDSGSAALLRETQASGTELATWIRARPSAGVELFFDGVPKFATLVEGAKVIGPLLDLDNSGEDALSAMTVRTSLGGWQFAVSVGNLFIRQTDVDGLGQKVCLQADVDGKTTLRFNSLESIRTEDATVVGSGSSVRDGVGQFKPVGFNSLPTDIGGNSGSFTVGPEHMGRRFRPNATITVTIDQASFPLDGFITFTQQGTGTTTILGTGGVVFTLFPDAGGTITSQPSFTLTQGDWCTIARIQTSSTHEVWGKGL